MPFAVIRKAKGSENQVSKAHRAKMGVSEIEKISTLFCCLEARLLPYIAGMD
jgi:hypothetical protein